MVIRNRNVLAAVTASAVLALPLATFAQEGAVEEKKPRRVSRALEEVVVTAQKREENANDVPISIQAFSPEQLAAFGVESTTDLMKVTPGLDMGTQAGDFTSVFMRGIGSEAWLTSDPSVATYIDGVYYPFAPSVAQDLKGVERLEVLKGPQGTLFGRNAVGGAINVILKKPDFEDTWTEVSVSASQAEDRNKYEVGMFVNVPLTDTVAMNFAGSVGQDDKVFSDSSTIAGSEVPADKIFAGRAMLRWQPNDMFDTRLTIQGAKRDGTSTLAANIDPTPLGTVIGIDGDKGRNYEVDPDLPIFGHLQSFVISSQSELYLPYMDVKFLASQQAHSNPYNYDYDGTSFPSASFIVQRHDADIDEAEIQFLSNDGTPFSDWLTLTGGAFYFKKEQGFDPVELTVGGADLTNLSAALGNPGGLLGDLLGALTPVLGEVLDGVKVPVYALSNIGMVEGESWSVFMQATAQVTEWMAVTLGGRYQDEYVGVAESGTTARILNGEEIPLFDWQQARDENNEPYPLGDRTKAFTPKVAVDFTPFEDGTLIYASYQEAIKAHSYNAFAFYLNPAYVPAEETTAYEVGIKTRLFNDTVQLNLAAFRYELENLQSQSISLTNGGALSLDSAGNSESNGWEFDIKADVFPSIFEGSLIATINGTFLDAEYTEYIDGAGHDPVTGIFTPNNDFTGNTVTRTPEFSGSASLSNTWFIPGGPLEATVSYYYNDGFFYAATNDPRFSQPKYDLWGAHLSYFLEESNLRVTLSGQNLADEFYTAGMLKLDFGALGSLGARRSLGLAVDYEF
ncbi:outer membrane receptor protein [Spongiibacter sp. IMCC21906]|uniref:TonB-dependent receptor n=1 Tax=Spongiibacter sp. IMCC21906 TaxID=1620392 RepID=UPI00062DF586|nr:TonB-dependent receptor plug domain-containing protein [Spongiibacter sp. IMCC21906]AKH67911.1 outer membrane receptor protein [Spongiibacter sp. IMCC21906]